ncbi:hypothetical protein ACJRO7_021790 [Eucalyptus globulus]|uniref:Cysteine-rich receptor-like protein kinase 10 n=1 Tax=Eucalyptus globulus TaxID=34317 RepID=A0ABD3KMI4_EUCGL
MSSSFTISLPLLFSINLFIGNSHTSEAALTYTAFKCSGTKQFLPGSTYQKNLNELLSSLSSAANSAGNNSSSSGGFSNAAAGSPPDQAYGIFLCRGDIDALTCSNCISTAAQDIGRQCPGKRTSIIWYDVCMLRYSNRPIYSVMQTAPASTHANRSSITDDPSRFIQLLKEASEDVARKAPSSRSGKKVAAAEAELTDSPQLYMLAECTPDLTPSDCRKCLRWAIAHLPQATPGGRVLTPSCNVRFREDRFYNATALGTVVAVGGPPPVQHPSAPAPATGPKGKSNKSATITIAIIVTLGGVMVLLFLTCCVLRRKRKKRREVIKGKNGAKGLTTVESLQFDLATIQAATNYFSPENKLGEGGFGEVFQGRLPNGQQIAVKRLSRRSRQGVEEFKNEILLVAKLQHRNLVRLLGFCLEGDEKLLAYEFVPNKSLDYFLFDPEKRRQLDWPLRHKIVFGIARGMLYLHEDSRLRVIHRDLKCSNILLDSEMNPKISDFGMARIFGVDQTQASTNKIVGTFGYMSPEYAMHGEFSVKSDVYSFGIILLEIICGKKNNYYHQLDEGEYLASYVWNQWRDGKPLEVLDPAIMDSYSRDGVLRCLHICLLCIQEDPTIRPTMATVVLMLSNNSFTLPSPQHPAFFVQRSLSGPSIQMEELKLNQSPRRTMPSSTNGMSVTELCPR